MGTTDPVPSEDDPVTDNVLGSSFTADKIKKMILDRVDENMDSGKPLLGEAWCNSAKAATLGNTLFGLNSTDTTEEVRDKVATKVAENLADLPDFDSTAPARDKMPQFSGKYSGGKIKPDEVFKNFADGKVNFREPFDESIDVRRWNKLAGLLKD